MKIKPVILAYTDRLIHRLVDMMGDKTDKTKLLDKEKDSFFYGLGMQKNWVIVNQKYLDYVGSKYR